MTTELIVSGCPLNVSINSTFLRDFFFALGVQMNYSYFHKRDATKKGLKPLMHNREIKLSFVSPHSYVSKAS